MPRVLPPQIVLNLPEFTGKGLSEFRDSFGWCLRMTGQTQIKNFLN